MLEWKIKNGDDKLREEIQRTKDTFESWYKRCWERECSREKMLSKDSPLEHVYYKMTKSPEEVKEKYPLEAKQECSSCGKYVDEWIETKFSFCDEYGCGMCLCKDCAKEFTKEFKKFSK